MVGGGQCLCLDDLDGLLGGHQGAIEEASRDNRGPAHRKRMSTLQRREGRRQIFSTTNKLYIKCTYHLFEPPFYERLMGNGVFKNSFCKAV